jgi:hypothetical protein
MTIRLTGKRCVFSKTIGSGIRGRAARFERACALVRLERVGTLLLLAAFGFAGTERWVD